MTKWFQPEAMIMYVNDDEDDDGYTYDDDFLDDFDRNWISVGMKVGCAWTCGLVYLVYLLFPGKDLSHGELFGYNR